MSNTDQRQGMQERLDQITDTNDPDKQKVTQELVETLGDAHDTLLRATTVFPLTLFTDTIIVDRAKLTITRRNFFQAGEVMSIAIEDILNITATVGPFFGKITIATRFFDPNKPYVVDHFWRKDALRIKRVVQSYLIAQQKDIDTSVLSTKELSGALNELGKPRPDEYV